MARPGNDAAAGLFMMEKHMDYEVKADGLDASFDGFQPAEPAAAVISQLRGEMEKLSARVREMGLAGRRPPLGGVKAADSDPARKAFVDGYLRKGIEGGIEVKKLSLTDSEGGFAVPREIDAQIAAILKDVSPIRRVANVVQVGSANYRKLIVTGGLGAGWGTETLGSRTTDTSAVTFREVVPPMGDLFANPAASQAMLDDSAFDVEGWLAREIARDFAKLEGAAFVNGDGVNKPRGFIGPAMPAPVTTGDATRAFGTLQYVPSGVAADLTAPERLIDLVVSLRPAYRQGAVFVMNSATLGKIRKMKDTAGQFLFQPSLIAGTPSTLLGYPIVEAEDMPDVAANAFAIAFGNFMEGYVVTERPETGVLRDPFTNKPFVHFYASKRVGGGVVNSEAVKLMRISVS